MLESLQGVILARKSQEKKKRDGKGPGNSELSRNSLVILTSARCIREM